MSCRAYGFGLEHRANLARTGISIASRDQGGRRNPGKPADAVVWEQLERVQAKKPAFHDLSVFHDGGTMIAGIGSDDQPISLSALWWSDQSAR